MDYTGSEYLLANPTWHVEDSPWKAAHILRGMSALGLQPRSVLDIGCGAGVVLSEVARRLPDPDLRFHGIDVAAGPVEQAKRSSTDDRVTFEVARLSDLRRDFDVAMLIDVVEHVPDYFGLLAEVRDRAEFVIAHVPLEMNVSAVLRRTPLQLARRQTGHIHHFNTDTVLAAFRETGYEVLHTHYTAGSIDLPPPTRKARAARLARKALRILSEATAANLLGGYSLLVVARGKAASESSGG